MLARKVLPLTRRCNGVLVTIKSPATTTVAFSSKAKSTSEKKPKSLSEFQAQKAAAKQYRTDLYNSKMERKARLPSRRDEKKKNYNKNLFRQWFDPLASRQAYYDRDARRQGLQWKIKVAAMVERLPVVTPDMPDWELDYLDLRAELDRYRKQYPKELGLADPMDKKPVTLEELYASLPEGFTPAPRETIADETGDIQTLERKLKTRVYLSVRPDDATGWVLPTATLEKDETILDGAKRATSTIAGDKLKMLCLSNCPMAVDMVPYSEEELKANDGFYGEKIFYMRVQYDEGDVEESKLKNNNDWGWLDRSEMTDRVKAEKGEEAGLFYHYML